MKRKIFDLQVEIGENIRFFRRKRGFTLATLSQKLKISAQQLQKYEAGTNRISVTRLSEIAFVLDVPIQNFLSEIETENKAKSKLNENGLNKLIYYYTRIRSEKLKRLIVQTSSVYVDSNL